MEKHCSKQVKYAVVVASFSGVLRLVRHANVPQVNAEAIVGKQFMSIVQANT